MEFWKRWFDVVHETPLIKPMFDEAIKGMLHAEYLIITTQRELAEARGRIEILDSQNQILRGMIGEMGGAIGIALIGIRRCDKDDLGLCSTHKTAALCITRDILDHVRQNSNTNADKLLGLERQADPAPTPEATPERPQTGEAEAEADEEMKADNLRLAGELEAAEAGRVKAEGAINDYLNRGPSPNEDGCNCDRNDEEGETPLCLMHQRRYRALSAETLRLLVIDYEATITFFTKKFKTVCPTPEATGAQEGEGKP
jgi:hypothetical protein